MKAIIKTQNDIVTYDAINHCYIVKLNSSDLDKINVAWLIKRIFQKGKVPNQKLAKFVGVRDTSTLFTIMFTRQPRWNLDTLKPLMKVDDVNMIAKLYHVDHITDDGGGYVHISPVIVNCETEKANILVKTPTAVTSRLFVKDVLNRILTLTLTPSSGYMLDNSNSLLAVSGAAYTISGSVNVINRALRDLRYVPTEAGETSIVMKIDDNSGAVGAVVSTTVVVNCIAAKSLPTPTLSVPEKLTTDPTKFISVEGIVIGDSSGEERELELKITTYRCSVVGYISDMHLFNPGMVHIARGTAAKLNAEIANLRVLAHEGERDCIIDVTLSTMTDAVAPFVVNKHIVSEIDSSNVVAVATPTNIAVNDVTRNVSPINEKSTTPKAEPKVVAPQPVNITPLSIESSYKNSSKSGVISFTSGNKETNIPIEAIVTFNDNTNVSQITMVTNNTINNANPITSWTVTLTKGSDTVATVSGTDASETITIETPVVADAAQLVVNSVKNESLPVTTFKLSFAG